MENKQVLEMLERNIEKFFAELSPQQQANMLEDLSDVYNEYLILIDNK
jgi:hypothetical protein